MDKRRRYRFINRIIGIFLLLALTDENFRLIVTKPDNVPNCRPFVFGRFSFVALYVSERKK